ncbi:MAG: MerR family transcriptional regulator [Bacillota bacterium]
MYKINEVAKLAGISVRTLHHYDSIGLLKPAEVGDNSYRLYSDDDLARLQQILFFKELEFPLQEIRAILDNPSFDRRQALHTHKQLLEQKKHRLENILASVEQTLQSIEGGRAMSKQDMFEPFDMKKIEEHQKKYEQEVKEKYGHTDAYKQSAQRTAAYKEEDWKRIHAESEAIYRGIIGAMHKGPADEEVQKYVDQFRSHITSAYYDCTPEIFRGLGDLYVYDERFTKNIDKYQDGLAVFLRDAMHVYCDRLEAGKK